MYELVSLFSPPLCKGGQRALSDVSYILTVAIRHVVLLALWYPSLLLCSLQKKTMSSWINQLRSTKEYVIVEAYGGKKSGGRDGGSGGGDGSVTDSGGGGRDGGGRDGGGGDGGSCLKVSCIFHASQAWGLRQCGTKRRRVSPGRFSQARLFLAARDFLLVPSSFSFLHRAAKTLICPTAERFWYGPQTVQYSNIL